MHPFWASYISKMQVMFISSHAKLLPCVCQVSVYECAHMLVGRDRGEGMWKAGEVNNTCLLVKSFKLLKSIAMFFFLTLTIVLLIKFPNMQIEISHDWPFHWLLRAVPMKNSHGVPHGGAGELSPIPQDGHPEGWAHNLGLPQMCRENNT